MRITLLGVLGIAVLGGIFVVGSFWGDKHALDHLVITEVTPDEMVQAMSADNFYGLYRESTLLITGIVADVSRQNGETLVQLGTHSSSKAYCDIGTATTTLSAGDSIRALAEGEIANRLPQGGVMLVGCKVL